MSRRSADFDFRMSESDTGVRTITGHGSVFDSPSEDLGGFREIIHKGAFDDAIANSDVRCLINHEANLILGRNTSGTLRLSITDTGLGYECDLPDTTYARDLTVSLDRGDISQSSFAFTMDWEKEGTREDGGTTNTATTRQRTVGRSTSTRCGNFLTCLRSRTRPIKPPTYVAP